MEASARTVGFCCAAIIAALYVVGLVSGTELRHAVQTAPIWIGVALGLRRSAFARWFALPFFLFWLLVAVLIWLFLLGIARIVSGHFTPTEVAMTIVMAVASVIGIVSALTSRKRTGALAAIGLFVVGAALQFVAFRISVLPGIANR
jgi:hypothetical protein